MLLPSIAFVGAGPTTIYTVHALLQQATRRFALTIFEEQSRVGQGTPYRPGWNDPAMLSNIASIEIPPLETNLVDWFRAQPAVRLISLGVNPAKIGERTFYPRVALGEYFAEQFAAILDRARHDGIDVRVRTRCRVVDAVSSESGMVLSVRPRHGAAFHEQFDHVVLATGHQWPAEPEMRPGYFVSPWPASALAEIPPSAIGIRGSSLTAIDAAVALAVTHGSFISDGDGSVRYEAAPNADLFHITMMSRKGLLPEADFFAPLPYEPLHICTAGAIEHLIAESEDGLLDKAFELFKQELADADPVYSRRIGLATLDLETFFDRYFEDRVEADPFVWAEGNLAEAQANYRDKVTIAWRYAILRMHEPMGLLVPHLEGHDFKRFSRFFKPIFVDGYATVPHKSIKRMLALHRAGRLDILATGDDYRIDTQRPEGGATVEVDGTTKHFPVFIEATGQKALAARDFPFPSLVRQGVVRDASAEPSKTRRGILIDDAFHPVSDDVPADQLFCLSLPFIMGKHPFIQGITSSHEMGLVVGEQLAAALERDAHIGFQSSSSLETA